jgi:hypothetical protein
MGSIQKLLEEERQNREFMTETKLKELEGIDERLSNKLQLAINVGPGLLVAPGRGAAADPVHR